MTKRPYLKGEARAAAIRQAADLYAAGASVRSVATQLGRSYGGTYALLREAKVTFRPRRNGLRKAAS